jgi:hypothetical protein
MTDLGVGWRSYFQQLGFRTLFRISTLLGSNETAILPPL